METAQALHGQDAPSSEHVDGAGEHRIGRLAGIAPRHVVASDLLPTHLRTAIETRVGLRVKPPVARIGVFGRTGFAHLETAHRRGGPVIGKLVDDREARTAVRAVDEWVAVPAVIGIVELAKAIIADAEVGRDERALVCVVGVGFANLEPRAILKRHLLQLDFGYLCGRRRIHVQLGDELVEQLRFGLRVDKHAVAVVEHPAAHDVAFCQTVHERPEPHALHDSPHADIKRIYHGLPHSHL